MKLSAKWSIAVLAATMAFAVMGCSGAAPEPPVAVGQSVTASNQAQISVESFKLAQPDFVDREHKAQRTNDNQAPLAVLRLKITNNAASDIKYKPLHFAEAAHRIQVCTDPNKETGERTNVPAIAFAESLGIHTPTQKIDQMVTIPAGKSIFDDYLFEQPMNDQQLIALVPGDIVGDSSSKVFKFYLSPLDKNNVETVKPAKLNQEMVIDDLGVTVVKAAAEYVEVANRDEAVNAKLKYPYAYSKKPVLVVEVVIKNSGRIARPYDPSHSAAVAGINLSLQKIGLKRVLIDAPGIAKGQFKGKGTIEAGQSIRDVYLFELPGSSGQLDFSLSGHILGVDGVYRYKLDYHETTPPAPDLKPYLSAGKEGEGAEGEGEGEGEEEEEEGAEGAEAAPENAPTDAAPAEKK